MSHVHALMLPTEEGLLHVAAPLVGQVALVDSKLGWLDVTDTGDTVLELSLLRTWPSLSNATVGAGLPLNTHVRTASEPEVAMRLGVTEVLVEIAGETKHQLTSHKDATSAHGQREDLWQYNID